MTQSGAPSSLKHPCFRADINGLRAWAVLLVMLYHFGVPGFSGGFVGVDIFLVISGYLMTTIVVGGLESGQFKLHGFVAARLRRVLPALAALCATLLILGWLFLNAVDYRQLAAESLSSISFVSNIRFWNEAGYFDAAAQEKWLLHTWSLSLEVQFYLTFAVLMLISWLILPSQKISRKIVAWGTAISVAISMLATPDIPSAAFYLLPARYWEFLAGGLVALNSSPALSARLRRFAEASGFFLVIASSVFLSDHTLWPGAWALLPVSGAVLVIIANNPNSRLTSGKLAQWLGTRSYSAYLWHWPLVVLLGYLSIRHEPLAVALGIVMTLALADVSYRWFERVPAHWLDHGRWLPWVMLAAASTSIWTASMLIDDASGVPGRLPPAVDLVAAESQNRHPKPDRCFETWKAPGTSCLYGGDKIAVVLVGDSHASSVASALAMARTDPGSGVLALIYPGCITVFSVKMTPGVFRAGRDCAQFNRAVRETVRTLPSAIPIVLVSRTSAYALGLDSEVGNAPGRPAVYFTKEYDKAEAAFLAEFSDELVKSACELRRQHPVYLVRPIPEMPVDVPKAVARALALGVSYQPHISLADYTKHHQVVLLAQDKAAASCGVVLLDPRIHLCKSGVCPGVIGGRPIYFDDDHLSEYGNKLLIPMFQVVFAVGTPTEGSWQVHPQNRPVFNPRER